MKHSQVKQNIIETASSLFYRNGYNATGINEIIAQAGIAKATLYSHFRSKEDICLSYLQFKNSTFLSDIKTFCDAQPKGKTQLLAVFDFLKLFFEEKDFNGCWCIKTVSEIPKENERVRNEIQKQKNEFIQFLKDLIVINTTHAPTKSDSLARKIYLLYEGAVTESHLHQSEWPIEEAKELCAKIF
ncbi:MAG: TetR/AcrR family transcriptional regulator [Bacteroidota bacterium]